MTRHGSLVRWIAGAIGAVAVLIAPASGQGSHGEVVDHPFVGITHITRTETAPRRVTLHVLLVDLTAPGIRFKLTPPSGARETVRQTTLAFLETEGAQAAVNSHFFLPFPSTETDVALVGLAASEGRVYSAFETPDQSYAIVRDAPAINIDRSNRAVIVHRDPSDAGGARVVEPVVLWNALAGSAQIVTKGVKTIPVYADASFPRGLLLQGGPADYSNDRSWYEQVNARTAIGLADGGRRLVLITVDRAGASLGMTVGEVASILLDEYEVHDALNLDGGGSTTLVMEDPVTHRRAIVNQSSDGPSGRAVGSNLAVFARPATR